MRIGFEAKRAFRNFTGLGNYSRAVIKIMAQYFPENQHILYSPQDNQDVQTSLLKAYTNISIKIAPIKLLSSFWRTFQVSSLLKYDDVDIFHGLSNELPAGIRKTKVASVVTIHDLIYLRFPHYFKFIDRKIYNFKFRSACKNADRIIAISEQTKKDIIQFYKVSPSKIDVVYQGCDPSFYNTHHVEDLQKIKVKYQLPNQYLLCVGTIESRKNQLLIIKALQQINEDIKLVLVGKATAYKQELLAYITQNNLEERVIFLEKVPFQDLPLIYQSAYIFVYPSRFEGFGIPILEALNAGVPVIGATGSCLEEAGGSTSIYIHPDDALGLAAAIQKIDQDLLLRERMIEEGKSYTLKFREENIASNLMMVYQKTLQDAKRRS